jgi:hypothetical protein
MKIFNYNVYWWTRIDSDYSSYIIYVGTKHNRRFIIDLLCFEFEVNLTATDWMIEGEYISGDKKYRCFDRNPKYDSEIKDMVTWTFPK